MNEQKKDLNEILKELHKILEDLSVEAGIQQKNVSDSGIENLRNKIREKEEEINTVDIKTLDISRVQTTLPSIEEKSTVSYTEISEEKKVFEKPVSNLEKDNCLSLKEKEEKNQIVEGTNRENLLFQPSKEELQSTEHLCDKKKEEEIVVKPETLANTINNTTSVPVPSANNANQNIVNTIFIYPLSVPEAKEMFYEQINNTLKRVCKKPVEMKPIYELSFADPDNELTKRIQEILGRIRANDVKGLFIITNESFILDDFVSKFTNEVFMVKLIKYSELKTKTLYLDIAIEMLLALK